MGGIMSFAKRREGEQTSFNVSPSGGGSLAGSDVTAAAVASGMDAYIGRGAKVSGKLSFTGPVELDGQVEGEIESKDRLIIGESAIINAKISGADILVKGTVNGDIIASKRLSLKKPAKVTGNITSKVLSIDEGVQFEGKCSMTNNIETISTDKVAS